VFYLHRKHKLNKYTVTFSQTLTMLYRSREKYYNAAQKNTEPKNATFYKLVYRHNI